MHESRSNYSDGDEEAEPQTELKLLDANLDLGPDYSKLVLVN